MKLKSLFFRTIVTLVLIFTLLTNTAFAATAGTKIYVYGSTVSYFAAPNGGAWYRDNIVTSNYNMNGLDYAVYYSPAQVKAMYNALTKTTSKTKLGEAVKMGADVFISSGVEAAKKAIIAKFGATIASQAVPILGAFMWAKTAWDFFNIIDQYIQLKILEGAINANTGLIHYSTDMIGNQWVKWNGSSKYGSYPNVKINDKQVAGYFTYH